MVIPTSGARRNLQLHFAGLDHLRRRLLLRRLRFVLLGLLVRRILRVARRWCRRTRDWLGEFRVVQRNVCLDALPRVLRLVGARAPLGSDGEREGIQNAGNLLIVPQLDFELALGAAHHPLHFVLDRDVRVRVHVVGADVAVAAERRLHLEDVGAFDLVGADQLDLVSALLVVEERIVELRVLDDPLDLIFTEGLGVLLSLPGLDLPTALSVPRVDADHAAEREFLADLVRPLALVLDLRLESAATVELSGAAQRVDGLDAFGAPDALLVFRDDLVDGLRSCGSGEEEEREKGKGELSHNGPRCGDEMTRGPNVGHTRGVW